MVGLQAPDKVDKIGLTAFDHLFANLRVQPAHGNYRYLDRLLYGGGSRRPAPRAVVSGVSHILNGMGRGLRIKGHVRKMGAVISLMDKRLPSVAFSGVIQVNPGVNGIRAGGLKFLRHCPGFRNGNAFDQTRLGRIEKNNNWKVLAAQLFY